MFTVWQTGLYIDQEIVFPDSPWLHGGITAQSLIEQPTPTSYIQRDGWITAVITAGTLTESPTPSEYFYMPSNDWLLTNNIATPAAVEKPTPTEYLQATA